MRDFSLGPLPESDVFVRERNQNAGFIEPDTVEELRLELLRGIREANRARPSARSAPPRTGSSSTDIPLVRRNGKNHIDPVALKRMSARKHQKTNDVLVAAMQGAAEGLSVRNALINAVRGGMIGPF